MSAPPALSHSDESRERPVLEADHGMGVVQRDVGIAEVAADLVGNLLHRRGGGRAERELGLAAPAPAP